MNWLVNVIEGLESIKENTKISEFITDMNSYLKDLYATNAKFPIYAQVLSEYSKATGLSQSQLLDCLEPSVKDLLYKKEYEGLKGQIEISYEDYLKIRDFSSFHDLEMKVDNGILRLVNDKGLEVLKLDSKSKTGEVLIGEYRFRQHNELTGVQRGELRLSGYEIRDTYNVYGPNSDLVGSSKSIDVDGRHYDIPIEITEEEYHGMLVRVYGNPNFSEVAVDTININSDAVEREASSHKVESTAILARNFVEGKYPPGTFSSQQEKELIEIANGKKAETISGLTPHHVGNAKMQYVPQEVHRKINHIGGSWLMNEKNYFESAVLKTSENRVRFALTSEQVEYVKEVIPLQNTDFLISRIDELKDNQPPKAIDSDTQISSLIEPIRESIPPFYLEAPQDGIQIEKMADAMKEIEGVDFSVWKSLSLDDRMDVLQKVEEQAAAIAHRPVCELTAKSLGEGYYGYYSNGEYQITLNNDYISSDSFADYKETFDTLIHEGRHAYQDYNLYGREIHPRHGDVSNWQINEFQYGYQDVKHCGFKAYEMQPKEADARAFAEDVLDKYLNKTV